MKSRFFLKIVMGEKKYGYNYVIIIYILLVHIYIEPYVHINIYDDHNKVK